uniref:Methylated-DNA--protein-cysteine methyltransferase n=1 Tax=Plectus sambesii TaxID=2011161 RepID=A0A914V170_9BILA
MACSRVVSSAIVRCPIGMLHISACESGLHGIRLDESIVDENFATLISKQQSDSVFIHTKDTSNNDVLQDTFTWLQKYFSREVPDKKPALCLPNENDCFMIKCWLKALEDVPFGKTVSYGQLAEMAENPKAARAVGQAMRKNKFVLLVPCHRVVRSDGSLGHYNAGKSDTVKRWLIDFEKNE